MNYEVHELQAFGTKWCGTFSDYDAALAQAKCNTSGNVVAILKIPGRTYHGASYVWTNLDNA